MIIKYKSTEQIEDMEVMKLMCVSKINVQWYPDGLQLGEWGEESQKNVYGKDI